MEIMEVMEMKRSDGNEQNERNVQITRGDSFPLVESEVETYRVHAITPTLTHCARAYNCGGCITHFPCCQGWIGRRTGIHHKAKKEKKKATTTIEINRRTIANRK